MIDDADVLFLGEEFNQISSIQDVNSAKSDEPGSSSKSDGGLKEISVTKE